MKKLKFDELTPPKPFNKYLNKVKDKSKYKID